MDFSRIIAVLGLLVIITGCTQQVPADFQFYTYMNSKYNYELQIPKMFTTKLPSSTGAAIGFINYDHTRATIPENGVYISVEVTSRPCSSALTGAQNMVPISTSSLSPVWGRVEAWDIPMQEVEGIICSKAVTPAPKEIYALCADRSGQTVVICIHQENNKTEMAQQIFESFRWTE